jgi:anti-anti-sigma regulatory factor
LRFPLRRRTAAWSRVAAPDRRKVSLSPGQVMCLRLSGQLCAGTTGALLDAVAARIGAAMPPVTAVVLDLSDTPAIDDDARAALLSLHGLLAQSQARLRLVLPEAATHAALASDDAASGAGLDTLYTSVRAALLAAYAALPGPALITPEMRTRLVHPPDLVLLPPGPPAPHPLLASAFRSWAVRLHVTDVTRRNRLRPGLRGALSGLFTESAPRKHRRPGRGYLQRHRDPTRLSRPRSSPTLELKSRSICGKPAP